MYTWALPLRIVKSPSRSSSHEPSRSINIRRTRSLTPDTSAMSASPFTRRLWDRRDVHVTSETSCWMRSTDRIKMAFAIGYSVLRLSGPAGSEVGSTPVAIIEGGFRLGGRPYLSDVILNRTGLSSTTFPRMMARQSAASSTDARHGYRSISMRFSSTWTVGGQAKADS